jgi:glycosyltransferase involved in cell wall biosynthesis
MTCTGRLIPTLRACRKGGTAVWALSLGRNRQLGTFRWYPATISRIDGVPVVYAAYWDCPILTHVVTILSLGFIIWRLRDRVASAVFWNAMPHYVLALFVSRQAGMRCVLDLEDGVRDDIRGFTGAVQRSLLRVWDRCADAAMVANSSLLDQIKTRPAYLYYSVARDVPVTKNWDGKLKALFSGHLSVDAGAEKLIESLLILRDEAPSVLEEIKFTVVGGGPHEDRIHLACENELHGCVEYRGRVTDHEYSEMLREYHIGLCLKMPDQSMGQSTFPSKVIEFASNEMLVVSYKVSDIPLLFPEQGAFLLNGTSGRELVEVLKTIAVNMNEAHMRAQRGKRAICDRLGAASVAKDLRSIWLGTSIN